MQLQKEKIDLEKHEAYVKCGIEKAKTFGSIKLEKSRLRLAQDAEDLRVMLADTTLLDPAVKKWLEAKKRRSTPRKQAPNALFFYHPFMNCRIFFWYVLNCVLFCIVELVVNLCYMIDGCARIFMHLRV